MAGPNRALRLRGRTGGSLSGWIDRRFPERLECRMSDAYAVVVR